jgi:N-acetylmuramate 1-kinase
MTSSTTKITTQSPEQTEALARDLALWIRPGFAVLLEGDLGSGKSVLARALIRAVAGDETLDVPSPSFSLVQSYDDIRVPLVHADLYRLTTDEQAAELGLADMLQSHGVVVEWPGLSQELMTTPHRLHIRINGSGTRRDIVLEAHGAWQKALARNDLIQKFLHDALGMDTRRAFLQGDASTRRYEQISGPATDLLLMDMPRQPDGPPVRNGLPYSAIAHLSESIVPVMAINRYLVSLGYAAPRTAAVVETQGLALIERLLGDVHGTMMQRGDAMVEPLRSATEVLADMATKPWPRQLPGHDLKDYDTDAQLIEVDLLPSWYWPFSTTEEKPHDLHQSFEAVWRGLLVLAWHDRIHWVLRDYHSPNLIWMPQRQGLQRTGLIDTQDAVIGHPAYDLVSLLQDARHDVDVKLHDDLFAYYLGLRQKQGGFDANAFSRAYAILGAQRACKLLGIFVRLCVRDGKPNYLQHLPRQKIYLNRNLQHNALAPLRTWFATHVPDLLT